MYVCVCIYVCVCVCACICLFPPILLILFCLPHSYPPFSHLHSLLHSIYNPFFILPLLLPSFHLHSFLFLTYALSFIPPTLLPISHLHSYLFLTSIVDGRYNEQKNRLQECGLKTCMYIVEGLTLTGNVTYRTVPYRTPLFPLSCYNIMIYAASICHNNSLHPTIPH